MVRMLEKLSATVPRFQHLWETGSRQDVENLLEMTSTSALGRLNCSLEKEKSLSGQVIASSLYLEKTKQNLQSARIDLEQKTAILNYKLGTSSPEDPQLDLSVRKYIDSCSISLLPYERPVLQILAWNQHRKKPGNVSSVLQGLLINPRATELQKHVLANILTKYSHTIVVDNPQEKKRLERRLNAEEAAQVNIVAVEVSGTEVKWSRNSIMSLLQGYNELIGAFFQSLEFDKTDVLPETWNPSDLVDISRPTFVVCNSSHKLSQVSSVPESCDFDDTTTLDLTTIGYMNLTASTSAVEECKSLWTRRLELEKHFLDYETSNSCTQHDQVKAELAEVYRVLPEQKKKCDMLEKRTLKFSVYFDKKKDEHRTIKEREEKLKIKLAELRETRLQCRSHRNHLRKVEASLVEKSAQDTSLDREETAKLQLLREEKINLDEWEENNDSRPFIEVVCDFLRSKSIVIDPTEPFCLPEAIKAMVQIMELVEYSVVFVNGDFPEVQGKQLMVCGE
ncbi:hypothetical protein CJU90_0703 [Yarrowia sp. C11]|nr:hypothetical protein CKK34_2115 [Yarrowia sp. E02]KAG5373037.1 hypothetical protein CJU90_0703 [Yarrowia sp. C11]